MSEERKAAERLGCRLLVVALSLTTLVLLVPPIWDKLSPFIISIPIAALLQPVIGFLQRRLKLKRGLAVIVPVALVCVLAVLLAYWCVSFSVTQITDLVNNSPTVLGDAVAAVKNAVERILGAAEHLPDDVVQWLRGSLNDALNWVYNQATGLVGRMVTKTVNIAAGIPYALVYANFLFLGLYFIAKDYPNIRSHLPGGQKLDAGSSASQITNSAITGVLGYLRVQTTYALLSLVAGSIYLQCFGFRYAVMIALAASVLEFLPLVGNGTMYVPWAVIAFINGDTAVGTELMILDLSLLTIRRLTEPKLLSSNIGISPLLSLIGMFVGMRIGGILGLVGGPVVMVVLVGMVRGPFFTGMERDARTLVAWFRRRWAGPPQAGTPGGTLP